MTAYLNVNGETALRADVHEPAIGVWWADVVMESDPALSGQVTLSIGDCVFVGTVDPRASAEFAREGRIRIIGGGGGWGDLIPAQHYHSDGGIATRTVADDAARLSGESLSSFVPGTSQIGVDYVRNAGPASRALEDAAAGSDWWVDRDGATVVGSREGTAVPEDTYSVLHASQTDGTYELSTTDLGELRVGRTILVEGESIEIGSLRTEVTAETERVRVWRVVEGETRDRLTEALRGIVRQSSDGRLFGRYRYRVVRPNGDRLELQAVAAGLGLPDVLPVAMRPGIAGAHTVPDLGSIVLVEFIEGDRTQPIVTAFAGRGEGHDAQEVTFSASIAIRLGSDGATEGVPLGTSLKSYIDGHTHDPGSFLTAVGSGGGGGPVMGVSGPPTTSSPAPSTKVLVE